MSPSRRARRTLPAILAAAILCVAADASAQELYKLVDTAGKITFSDRPDETGVLQPAPEPELVRVPKRIAGISSPRAAVLVNANEAARRLRQAQLKRDQGIEPMPREHTAGVPNNRYWQRQEKLRIEVEQAQRRSNATQRMALARQ